MKPELECGLTASFLGSGRILSNVSNCAALIAGAGIFLAHQAGERLLYAVSILCWLIASYLGVRVAIDASLFRELAENPVEGGDTIDEFLRTRGLLRVKPARPLTERSHSALRLWTRMIVIVAVQLAISMAALIMQAAAM